jgi:hypothetical protein
MAASVKMTACAAPTNTENLVKATRKTKTGTRKDRVD